MNKEVWSLANKAVYAAVVLVLVFAVIVSIQNANLPLGAPKVNWEGGNVKLDYPQPSKIVVGTGVPSFDQLKELPQDMKDLGFELRYNGLLGILNYSKAVILMPGKSPGFLGLFRKQEVIEPLEGSDYFINAYYFVPGAFMIDTKKGNYVAVEVSIDKVKNEQTSLATFWRKEGEEYRKIWVKQTKIKLEELNNGLKIETPGFLPASPRKAQVDMVVIHYTAGTTWISAYSTFRENPTQYSTHYIIDRDGTVYYIVDESLEALHAGAEVNDDSIGIDLVNLGNQYYTESQYSSLNALLKDIESRHPLIKHNNRQIVGHYETPQGIANKKVDPGYCFDWSRIGLPDHPFIGQFVECH